VSHETEKKKTIAKEQSAEEQIAEVATLWCLVYCMTVKGSKDGDVARLEVLLMAAVLIVTEAKAEERVERAVLIVLV
jgi:hypothetical protein